MSSLNCNLNKVLISALLLLFLTAFQSVSARNIAFLYALDKDLTVLKTLGKSEKALPIGNRKASIIHVGPNTVFAIKMNSGSIETAVSTQALLSRERIDVAFSTGPAGALKANLSRGEWLAIRSCLSYQAGSHTMSGHVLPEPDVLFENPQELNLPLAAIASGELFIASDEKKQEIIQQTDADLIDMNTAGLSTACKSHSVPLYCIRIVSDLADNQASKDFADFVQEYDGVGARLFFEWLKKLPPDETDPSSHPHLKKILSDG